MMKKRPTSDDLITERFIFLPTFGATTTRELRAALERIVQGVCSHTDVRMLRELIEKLASG